MARGVSERGPGNYPKGEYARPKIFAPRPARAGAVAELIRAGKIAGAGAVAADRREDRKRPRTGRRPGSLPRSQARPRTPSRPGDAAQQINRRSRRR